MTRSADEVAKSTDNDTEASHEAGISWDTRRWTNIAIFYSGFSH